MARQRHVAIVGTAPAPLSVEQWLDRAAEAVDAARSLLVEIVRAASMPAVVDNPRARTPAEPLLNTQEAAALLGVKPAFLDRDRWQGARIPFVRVGTRAVRYRRADLEAARDDTMRRVAIGKRRRGAKK